MANIALLLRDMYLYFLPRPYAKAYTCNNNLQKLRTSLMRTAHAKIYKQSAIARHFAFRVLLEPRRITCRGIRGASSSRNGTLVQLASLLEGINDDNEGP